MHICTRFPLVMFSTAKKLFKERDTLKVSLAMLNICGQHPHYNNLRDKIVWITQMICLLTICTCILIKLAQNYTDIDTIAFAMEAMNTFYQVTGNRITIIL